MLHRHKNPNISEHLWSSKPVFPNKDTVSGTAPPLLDPEPLVKDHSPKLQFIITPHGDGFYMTF